MMEEHLTRFLSQQAAAAAATRRGDLFLPPPHHHRHRLLSQQQQQHGPPQHHPYHGHNGRTAPSGGYVNVSDKRNRNPNWTDAEIVRFLEILQEESVMRDLLAQRNKQVFCYVAQRLGAEGADKTWDQCRIKLKNLKSQYRYVKERIPEVATMNLEDENSMKRLVTECQSRGISPSSLKHLKYLRRFLAKVNHVRMQQPLGGGVGSEISGDPLATALNPSSNHSSSFSDAAESVEVTVDVNPNHKDDDGEESVSPPPSDESKSRGLIIVEEEENKGSISRKRTLNMQGLENKRARASSVDCARFETTAESMLESSGGGGRYSEMQRLMDRLNRDMTERFLDHQRRTQAALHHWELERRRQEEAMAEQWRREAREHEARMFGLFSRMVSECNATIAAVVRLATESDVRTGGGDESNVRAAVAEENGIKVGDMVDGDDEEDEEREDINDDSDGA